MKKLTGVLLDVENEVVQAIEIEDSSDEFYRILSCETIDIVRRRIGRKQFNIICDDEGLLMDSPKISAIGNLGNPMLVGNLLIVSGQVDEDGNLTSLTKGEIKYVTDRIMTIYTNNFPEGYPMLTQCEY